MLVTGANGQVGWELIRSLTPLGDVIGLDRQGCDLSKPESLRDIVRSIAPDIVVNAAAYTAVDRAETEEDLAMIVNGTAVGVLAEESSRLAALFIHYSTDYVFDGTKPSAYLEDDPPCPINAYGRTKLAGERAVRDVGAAYIVLRTSWVYARRGRNFLRTVLRLAREQDRLRIVADQIGAPTWARSIAQATTEIVRQAAPQRAEKSLVSGLFHLTATGSTSWCGFAEAILEEAGRRGLLPDRRLPPIDAISTEDYPQPAARPKNSRLGGNGLQRRFAIELPQWRHELSLCLDDMRECSSH